MKQVVLIGDSVRLAYQPTVARELSDVAQVHGLPDCGNTRRVIRRLPDILLLAPRADVYHVNSGLHDIARTRAGGRYYVPLPEYIENLRQVIACLKVRTPAAVILATTTPVSEQRQLEDQPDRPFLRWRTDLKAYNDALVRLAASLDVEVNDLHELVMQNGYEDLLVGDGVHFTAEGSECMGKAVAAKIKQVL